MQGKYNIYIRNLCKYFNKILKISRFRGLVDTQPHSLVEGRLYGTHRDPVWVPYCLLKLHALVLTARGAPTQPKKVHQRELTC